MRTKKAILKVLFLLALFAVIQPTDVFSQEEEEEEDVENTDGTKYGTDSVECVKNLSLYSLYVKQKNYKDALMGWRYVFENCPKSRRSIYSHGVKIFKHLIENTKDEELKKKYIDTLLMIYDRRIEYFGDYAKYPEGWIRGRKGSAIMKYNKDAEAAYEELAKSVEMREKKTEAGVITYFMQTTIILYKKEVVDKPTAIDNYVTSYMITEHNIQKIKSSQLTQQKKDKILEGLNKVTAYIDGLFRQNFEEDADAIVEYFTPKYQETANDPELLQAIIHTLDVIKNSDPDIYYEAAIKLDSIQPSAKSAYNIAQMSFNRNNYSKAAKYYKKVIEREENDADKADAYCELAFTNIKLGQYSQAAVNAQEAKKRKENWGKPYIAIAMSYSLRSKSCGNSFEQKTVFWAAVDVLNTAKAKDPKFADEANKLIGKYSQYFPGTEDCHMYISKIDGSYTVPCLGVETTVRCR